MKLTDQQYRSIAKTTEDDFLDLVLHTMPKLFDSRATLAQAQVRAIAGFAARRGQPMTVSEIARIVGRPRTSVQAAIDVNVELGWTYFDTDPDDQRRHLIMLTDLGRAELRENENVFSEYRVRAAQRIFELLISFGLLELPKQEQNVLADFINEVQPTILAALKKHDVDPPC